MTVNGCRLTGLALALALTNLPAAAQQQQQQQQQEQQQRQGQPQQPAVGPPIQQIATAAALSTEPLGMIMSVRELPGGNVLVNDAQRRRLLLLDSSLKLVRVVLDSLSDAANFYGTSQGAGGLLPFRGDTTLFVDGSSYAMLVIDPAGNVVRVRSVWRVQDAMYAMSGGFGAAGLDARGRIVYRVPAPSTPPRVAPPAGVPWIPNTPDSAFVVAADIDARRVDTLGVVRIPKTDYRVYQTPGQTGFSIVSAFNPLPRSDGWAVMADGSVAFVRALDYRVDFLGTDGSWTSSDKLPYEWQRLTDEDKQRMVDSVRTAQRRSAAMNQVAALIRWVNTYRKQYPANFTVPQGFMLPPGLPKDAKLPPGVTFPPNYIYACPPGVEPTMVSAPVTTPGGAPLPGQVTGAQVPVPAAGARVEGAAGGQVAAARGEVAVATERMVITRGEAVAAQAAMVAPPGGAPAQAGPGGLPGAMSTTLSCYPDMLMLGSGREPPPPTIREPAVVRPDELPDYRPPMPNNAVRADLDGNLWIRTNPQRPGGIVYDIVNRQGELTTRLQTPSGYTIVGFGRDKVVYLSMRDASGIRLARVRLR